MEHALACNNLKCRQELSKQALVTTCSHIFCVRCADSLGITAHSADRRTSCPACKSPLANPDDAVIAHLNPSEEYKTSILSGLSPKTIMECAGRALSFWAYQTTQDICYQQYLYKNVQAKFSRLNLQLQKTVNDANSEMENLQQKIQGLNAEHDAIRCKNDELAAKLNDKSRRLLQTQELYDRVKRQAERGDLQRAASDQVDSSLQAPHFLGTGVEESWNCRDPSERDQPSVFNQTSAHFNAGAMNIGASRASPSYGGAGADGRWVQPVPMQRNEFNQTPSGGVMRQRLGGPAMEPQPAGVNAYRGTLRPEHDWRDRGAEAIGGPSFAHIRGGLNGVGLTSGLKVSQPASMPALETARRRY